MARLILIYKNKVVKKYKVKDNYEITIGRNKTNKIVIDHVLVSAQHAKVQKEKDGIMLIDLRSTNGTLVNNQRVSKCKLMHQDTITISNHTIIVDMHDSLSLIDTLGLISKHGSENKDDSARTMVLSSEPGHTVARIVFTNSGEEHELLNERTTIGKNRDANIPIRGFWSFLAGKPTAEIQRRGEHYFLSYSGGKFKPRVNGGYITKPVLLNHRDKIKIGPLEMLFVRGPA
ncbi:MAG: FHA domain-containing protein [Desulfobacteraceae bacterium]|nr:FHA domain-containing protein [Desulfobacteraceae bacterium]